MVSSDKTKIHESEEFFNELLNVAQIFEEKQKIIARNYDWNLDTFRTFKNFKLENFSEIIFHQKAPNYNGDALHVVYMNSPDAHNPIKGQTRPNCKWIYFLDIVADKLNATLNFIEIPRNQSSWEAREATRKKFIIKHIREEKLDFYLNFNMFKFSLESYDHLDWCFIAPLPPSFSIAEMVLILPLDPSCWMWLGITVAISALLWRISEHHWNFLFGVFALFVGKWVKVKT